MPRENINLNSPVSDLKGAGPQYTNKLFSLGVETLRDLLFHFPFRWDDFSQTVAIAKIKPDEKITIVAGLISVKNIRTFHTKMAITEAVASDNSGSLKIIWYNQPFLEQSLKEGQSYRFSGKAKLTAKGLTLQAPSFEIASREKTQTGGLIPVYHVTEGLSPKMFRYFIRQVIPYATNLKEYLPTDIIQRQNFLSFAEAVKKIHFPENRQDVMAAKTRLGFDELFIFQLSYQIKKVRWQKNKAIKIKRDVKFIKKILSKLPFELTRDQKIALWETVSDCSQTVPMNRLLEGDVGSGKTIVAVIACFNASQKGYQTALMAPTEILARQHFEEVKKIAGQFNIHCALLTNSLSISFRKRQHQSTKEQLLQKINKGEIKLVVGTHAVIQKNVNFKNLALVVIDEQHRFGVKQRSYLINTTEKTRDGLPNTVPHLLSMTATPIPRSLALTVFGDLNISLIKQLPKGRRKIITKIITPRHRSQTYQFIREQIKKGRQAFIICPLIEESEILIAKAVKAEYEKLNQEIFPDLTVGLLHGKLKTVEKEQIMKKFSQNKISILISTSVVEVGIDIPNATVMVIEGAERFGLSQLHQFRGRVGRGKHQSFCFLFTESPSQKTWERIKSLEQTQDGFKLAQKDLNMRGPGELLGERQSGFSNLTIASLRNIQLIKTSRMEAETLIKKDLQLKSCPLLKKRMKLFNKNVHFE
ncbi:MAG: ATP-dependent DNA helicase RecG [Patescibacteria group bacterium]|nr:ATP-dependent DNA helicase RecG [Patescibacteria group bacterium]